MVLTQCCCTVLEMINNALSFFAYQKQNEVAYTDFLAKKAEGRTQEQARTLQANMDEVPAQLVEAVILDVHRHNPRLKG